MDIRGCIRGSIGRVSLNADFHLTRLMGTETPRSKQKSAVSEAPPIRSVYTPADVHICIIN